MTLIDLWMVRLHAARFARRHGVASGDPRLREIERDALLLMQEGAGAREAVELAAVPVLRLYGLPRARAG
ncbi:hypothetical protein [Anaeromyxobacter sp. PSR-1]|uniref:hypothetical protein n=1 Tax=Anaeromyxobacter sp. PSR-1 TaxID=1300915 RepID=UPI0012699FDB|nr:hypothetical protein [Anaeromyxobacter sp. PSR-1]